MKADPLAFRTVLMPRTDSIVHRSRHVWRDAEWMERRRATQPHERPMSIYEVHLGSWRLNPEEGNRSLRYLELAEELAEYVSDLGFTHVELMPVMEHPFSGSWGYQVTSYFAPTARFGAPDDFKQFVDHLHSRDIGVIVDWVPAHFPRDDWALARFDGTSLYEHDHLRGSHPDWGTLIFNYGRHEVRNFLESSAFFWPREYHVDGIRVDGVASMLYLDYSRSEGEWVPNMHGGREDLEAISFIQETNEILHRREPGVISVAEESTAWGGVSRPTFAGGLGFGFKWNMGWMHDTLGYFQHDPDLPELPPPRAHVQHALCVHRELHPAALARRGGAREALALYEQMAGDRWQKLANLRALYGYMWAHPGKKLLFMGGELAQEQEWSYQRSIDWHLLEQPEHAGVQRLVRDLNHLLRQEPALYEQDYEPAGFWWLEPNDAGSNVFAFARGSRDGERLLVCAANLSAVPRAHYRVGLPRPATGSKRSTPIPPATAARMWEIPTAFTRSRSRGTARPTRLRSRCPRWPSSGSFRGHRTAGDRRPGSTPHSARMTCPAARIATSHGPRRCVGAASGCARSRSRRAAQHGRCPAAPATAGRAAALARTGHASNKQDELAPARRRVRGQGRHRSGEEAATGVMAVSPVRMRPGAARPIDAPGGAAGAEAGRVARPDCSATVWVVTLRGTCHIEQRHTGRRVWERLRTSTRWRCPTRSDGCASDAGRWVSGWPSVRAGSARSRRRRQRSIGARATVVSAVFRAACFCSGQAGCPPVSRR